MKKCGQPNCFNPDNCIYPLCNPGDKVSFDFDATLSEPFVQDYAKMIIERGVEVWIVTARHPDDHMDNIYGKNRDLFNVAKKLGIREERIVFTELKPKYIFFKTNDDFTWHLDDKAEELTAINVHTKVKGVWVLDKRTWMGTCERLLN